MLSKGEEIAFKKASEIVVMTQVEGYKHLYQLLLDKRNQTYPDPTNFTSDNDFLYAAKYASIYKKIIGEILSYMDEYQVQYDMLKRKKEEVQKSFGIGREVDEDAGR